MHASPKWRLSPYFRPSFFYWIASQDVASDFCQALGRGVTRSKQMAMRWTRKAAENGNTRCCKQLAQGIYGDLVGLRFARTTGARLLAF